MDFSYTEEQSALRQLAARLLGERFTDDFRRVFMREGQAYDPVLWSALAQAGVLGAAIDAAHGGSGLGFAELAVVLEEQGRTLAAVPLLATLVLGALPLQRFGGARQRELLPQVAAGTLLMTAALEEEAAGDLLEPGAQAQAIAGGWRLTGTKTCVPYADQAQFFVVSARAATGPRLFLLERQAVGLTVEPQQSTCGEPQGRVRLDGVLAGTQDTLAEDPVALQWLAERALVATAVMQLGVVDEALHRAAAYVSERQQFGRALGTFQAVQHRLADAYIDVEALRSVCLRAVWALDAALPAAADALCAKWWAAQAGHRVTHTVQHVHGGLGADLEYPVHAFFLRAKQLEVALGGAAPSLAALGRQLAAGTVAAFTREGPQLA